MPLNAKALGFTAGLMWGVSLFLMTLISVATGLWMVILTIVMDYYPGYMISVPGAFIGLAYGFIDGFVMMYILAWLYNRFEKMK
jgi:hypothetical protein